MGGGSAEEVEAMLDDHYNGFLDVVDYWTVGDSRVESIPTLASTAASGYFLNCSVSAQNLELIIIGINHDDLTTPINDITKAAITVFTKNVIGTTDLGGWSSSGNRYTQWNNSPLQAWMNNTFKPSISGLIPELIKPVNKLTLIADNYGKNLMSTSENVFLLSVYEAFGTGTSGYEDGTQYEYMKTDSNRGKSSTYWLRTVPRCSKSETKLNLVNTDGTVGLIIFYDSAGLVPAFCL